MGGSIVGSRFAGWWGFLATLFVAAALPPVAWAQSLPCTFPEPRLEFPRIRLWALTGAYRDSSLANPHRCVGSFRGPYQVLRDGILVTDTLAERPRTISVRFLRNRVAEARPDFGGYRIYRVTNSPDTSRMVLIRRFSRQAGDERTWNFSIIDPASLQYRCSGNVATDSIVTFVDPDSSGNFVKVCRYRRPQEDPLGACLSRGDSIFVLIPPPGPHDGFRTWYSITYEVLNSSEDAEYTDMFVPDLTGAIGPCTDPNDPKTCPNLNNKCYNLVEAAVEPSGGPLANLEKVGVVPNPYRAREAWDRPGAHEVHFVNLPSKAMIKVYTISGDLVREIVHDDQSRDFERWDLKNANGQDVSSGIYMYRIESDLFRVQDRFIVIR